MGDVDPNATVTNNVLFCMITQLVHSMKDEFFKALEAKDAKINILQMQVTNLSTKIDGLEQYTRGDSVGVSGIPETIDEHTNATIIRMATVQLEVKLDEHDIERSHRLGRK